MIDAMRGNVLVALARRAIETQLGRSSDPAPDQGWLAERGATFVTLFEKGKLRGCIGTIAATRCLRDDVENNARAAAFEDPRFRPLEADELSDLEVEVSVLSEPVPIDYSSREDLLTRLRPGLDGLVVEFEDHRATFLPQVWDNLKTSERFVGELLKKAGLGTDFWSDDLKFFSYRVEKFSEK